MKIILIIILTFIGCCAFAQRPFFYTEGSDTVQIDTTSLQGIENQVKPITQLNLGNYGSPKWDIRFNDNYFLLNNYSILANVNHTPEKRFYTYTPVTYIFYSIGAGAEQIFHFYHSQRITNNSFYTVGLDKIHSTGFYLNQNTNFTNAYLRLYQRDHNLRYSYKLDVDITRSLAKLNGGLEDDSTFINDTLLFSNRNLLDVNLLNASQDILGYQGKFWNTYYITNPSDSLPYNLAIAGAVSFNSDKRNFYDSLLNDNYYNYFFLDSGITKDEIKHRFYGGNLGVSFDYRSAFSSYLGLEVMRHDVIRSNLSDTAVTDLTLQSNFKYHKNNLLASGRIGYLINDRYDKNDLDLKANISYSGIKRLLLSSSISYRIERPALDLLRYAGNNANWNKSFLKQELLTLGVDGKYDLKDSTLHLNYSTTLYDLKNPIYFSYNGSPNQSVGVSQVINNSLGLHLTTKKWDVSYSLNYQFQGGYLIYNLPEWVNRLRVNHLFKMFKKKMDVAIGTEILYYNNYESRSYNPATNQLELSNARKLGGYPLANIYFKGRVKTFTFLLMMEHPHSGLLGNTYFNFPNYPMNDRLFRFGIGWLFKN